VVSLQEITDLEGDVITSQDIFVFEQTGVSPDGTVLGKFRATGIRPKFLERIKAFGVKIPDTLFDPARAME
ncbi:MAG: CpaF family protein, partial [Quisquiliibacterium sp.]